MLSLLSRTIVVLLATSLIGCTSLQTVAESHSAPISASQLNRVLAANDRVAVTDSAGDVTQLKLTSVGPDAIEGALDGSGQVTRLPLDRIKKIERRSFDGARTTILVVALVGGLYILIQAAGAATAVNFIG